MKTRFSFLTSVLFICSAAISQVHISVSDPETWSAQELAPYIGQTVIFDVPIVVCSNYSSSLTVSTRRFYSPTNQAYPKTPEYNSVVSLNSTGLMTLSGVPYASPKHRCGEKIYNLKAKVNSTGSLTWISGEFRGNTRADLEKGIPDVGDYRLLVCTMNLEYYLTENTGSGSMGPNSYEAHQRQRTKVNKALTKINADIYGLVEIEQGQEAPAEIAADLNANLAERNYTYINDGNSASGTYTKSAFVYDRNKVKPIGVLQHNNTGVKERKKMICFEEIATGERFIFSVNHFKAKSGNGTGGDADKHDGQGGYNASRVTEAQSVIDYYKRYYIQIKEKDILIMGDLNAYAKEDPITLLIDNGMIDLHRAFHADSSYSYQYLGQAGYLDHAISNGSLRPQVTGVAGFHINSDESDDYTYDKSNDQTMFRCSDHDPVVVGLKLDSTLTYDPSPALNTYEVLAGESDDLIIRNAASRERAFYAIYTVSGLLIRQQDLNGNFVDRKEIISEMEHVTLPGTAGMYILYIYADGQVFQRRFVVR